MSYREKGFGLMEVVLVIAVVALVGFIGWKVWQTTMTESDNGTDTSGSTSEQQVPEINDEEDLGEAERVLDETDVEGEQRKELDSETSF